MSQRIRKRKEDAQKLEVSEKVAVLPEVLEVVHEKTYPEFLKSYELSTRFEDDEKRIIYLKGYLNLTYSEIGKSMKISKSKALELGKKVEHEIQNVRIERGAEIRKQCGATKEDLTKTLSIFLGEAQQALLDKTMNGSELDNLNIEKLVKVISDVSEKLALKGETFVGRRTLPESMNLGIESTVSDEY